MKTKIFLSLSAALFLVLVGGFVSSQLVMAQYQKMQPSPMPQPANRIVWDYDSEWQEISPGEDVILNHALGGDPGDYFVYLLGYRASTGAYHQLWLGGVQYAGDDLGCQWHHLTETDMVVNRLHSDSDWNKFRLRILKNQ